MASREEVLQMLKTALGDRWPKDEAGRSRLDSMASQWQALSDAQVQANVQQFLAVSQAQPWIPVADIPKAMGTTPATFATPPTTPAATPAAAAATPAVPTVSADGTPLTAAQQANAQALANQTIFKSGEDASQPAIAPGASAATPDRSSNAPIDPAEAEFFQKVMGVPLDQYVANFRKNYQLSYQSVSNTGILPSGTPAGPIRMTPPTGIDAKGQPLAYDTEMVGIQHKLTPQQQQNAASEADRGHIGVNINPAPAYNTKDTDRQIMEGVLNTTQGAAYRAVAGMADGYFKAYHEAMPADLQHSLLTNFLNSPPDQQKELATAMRSGGAPPDWATGMLSDYVKLHQPKLAAQSDVADRHAALLSGIYKSYESTFGHTLDPAQADKLAGMNDAARQQWMDSQPYQGVTYGLYNSAQQSWGQKWVAAFGKPMSPAEVRAMAGKNDVDGQNFIDNSPSHVAGVNVKQYQDYAAAGDKMSEDLFGRPLDAQLIGLLHKEMS